MTIQTKDATRHDWDPSLARCKGCGVSKESIARFGAIYCTARYEGPAMNVTRSIGSKAA